MCLSHASQLQNDNASGEQRRQLKMLGAGVTIADQMPQQLFASASSPVYRITMRIVASSRSEALDTPGLA